MTLHGVQLLPLMLIEGAAGWTNPPLIGLSLAGIPNRDAGSAAGVLTTVQQIAGAIGVALIGVVFFGVLAHHAPTVSAEIAPALQQQLPAATARTTVADFRACADDRARSRDPAVAPSSCQTATLQPADPSALTVVAEALQRANARNYADAYVTAMFLNVGALFLAFVCALALPRANTPITGAKQD